MPTEFEKNWFRYVTLGPKMPTSNFLFFSLRYATTSYVHVHFKKIVTLRNDVICTRPISKKNLVSLRNDVK